MTRNPSCTIYVGNLPVDIREDEIEEIFYKVCCVIQCFSVHVQITSMGIGDVMEAGCIQN